MTMIMKKPHRGTGAHNVICELALLFAAAILISGCSQPLPVVHLSQSDVHDDSAANADIYLSEVVVISNDLPVASQEIERLVR